MSRALAMQQVGIRALGVENPAHAAPDLVFDNAIGDWYSHRPQFVKERLTSLLRESGNRPVRVHIDSPGGYASAGFAIYELLKAHRAGVEVYVYGQASSAASFILQAASPGKRFLSPTARVMIHNSANLAWGNASDLRAGAEALEMVDYTMLKIYVAATGRPEAEIKALLTNEGTWMSAERAVAEGFADEIVPHAAQANAAATALFDAGQSAFAQLLSEPEAEAAKAEITPNTPPPAMKHILAKLNLPEGATEAEQAAALARYAEAEAQARVNEQVEARVKQVRLEEKSAEVRALITAKTHRVREGQQEVFDSLIATSPDLAAKCLEPAKEPGTLTTTAKEGNASLAEALRQNLVPAEGNGITLAQFTAMTPEQRKALHKHQPEACASLIRQELQPK